MPQPDRVLIDTNIAIYMAKGHSLFNLYRGDLQGRELAMSFVTAAELLLTARRSGHPERALRYWAERFPYYVMLITDLETCEIWAGITAACYALGRPRQDNDLWNAAIAIRHELPLITHNRRDFEGIPDLHLVSYG